MKELEIRNGKVSLQWAWKMALIMIAISLLLFFINTETSSFLNYIIYIPFIAGLALCIKQHKEVDLEGYISFRRAFSTGFRYASIISFIMGIFMYIYLKYINVEVFEQSLIEAENVMLDTGKSQDEIDIAIDMTKSWGVFMLAVWTSISYTLFGAVLSLLFAAIFKKEEPVIIEIDEDQIRR